MTWRQAWPPFRPRQRTASRLVPARGALDGKQRLRVAPGPLAQVLRWVDWLVDVHSRHHMMLLMS